MFVPSDGFSYSQGSPKTFTRPDLDAPVTRETCGTHMLTRRQGLDHLILKFGTLDDPSIYAPDIAIHCADKQPFHEIPDGMTAFDRLPPRPSK